MLRVMIVDADNSARKKLAERLSVAEDIEVVANCGNPLEAIKLFNRHHPQVLFLDVHLPMLENFEFLSMIDEDAMPYLVFVTYDAQHALQAFEQNTIDYLLKPVSQIRLDKTLRKLRKIITTRWSSRYQSGQMERIPSVSGQKIKLIDPQQVEYIHSDFSGVHVTTSEGIFFTELTLKCLEKRLNLFRCHKQYLVNLEQLVEITPLENSQAEAKTRCGHKIPISRRYLRSLKDALHI